MGRWEGVLGGIGVGGDQGLLLHAGGEAVLGGVTVGVDQGLLLHGAG